MSKPAYEKIIQQEQQIPKEIFTEGGEQQLRELTNHINEIENNNTIINVDSHNSHPLSEN